ncbi:MAG: hypothetical protein Q8P27_01780, partial [Candidatus Peregrinibacteria bacterium]|nr:hypothetical protein [Candidatus Peregrinibacteria bacterium]
KIIGVLVAFIAIVIVLAFTLTSGVAGAGDDFMVDISGGNYEAAYDSTADSFKEITGYEEFAAAMEYYEFNLYSEHIWNSRAVENNIGILVGTTTLSDGTIYSLEMEFIKADGDWEMTYFSVTPTN